MVPDEEQTERISQLCEVCGVDSEEAKRILVATEWNLEQAIAVHLAGSEDSPSPTAGGEEPELGPGLSTEAREIDAPSSASGWFGSIGGALSRLSQAVLGIPTEDFETWFDGRFGSPTPSFSKLCFGEVVKEALDGNRLLVIWLYQEDNQATDALCKEVLQNDTVLSILRESYILWAGDTCRFEPGHIARLLEVPVFPALVVCQPLRSSYDAQSFAIEWPLGTFAQPILRIGPQEAGQQVDADHAMACLITAASDFKEAREAMELEAERRRARIAQERLLREEQDREYEEALFVDQLNAIRQREEEEARSRSVSPEKTKDTQPRVAEGASPRRHGVEATTDEATVSSATPAAETVATDGEVEQREREEEQRRISRGAEILAQPEPQPAGSATAKLQVRLPHDESIRRVFLADQTLADVYEWAHCCRPRPKPLHFDLRTSFPVRVLRDRSSTIADLGLTPSAALLLRECEENDSA